MSINNDVILGGSLAMSLSLLSGIAVGDDSPSSVIEDFLKYKRERDSSSAYELISEVDKEFYSLDQVELDFQEWNEYWAAEVLRETEYEIVAEEINGESATVSFLVTKPDLRHVFPRAYELSSLSGSEYYRDHNRYLNDYVDERGYDFYTEQEDYNLILQNGEWKVFLDTRKDYERREIARLQNLAFLAENVDGDYRKAAEYYRSILNIDEQNEEAIDGLEKVEKEIILENERLTYVENVEVYDIEAKMFESRRDGVVPGVTYKVKNNGDRHLSKVEVLFTFFDAEGNPIYEDNAFPVLANTSYGQQRPLPPGHIWQSERGTFRSFTSMPDEWDEGSVTAEVIEVEFVD